MTLDAELGAEGRRLFYCGTPPSAFPTIVRRIGEGRLGENARTALEKPIGHDLASALELGRIVREVFDEPQVFRIDHYLEERGRYYEDAGALRDVQNHLLQVLSFVAMEPPDSLAPEDVRDRKAQLLEAVRPFSADELVWGQYVAGVVEGHEVPGYRDDVWDPAIVDAQLADWGRLWASSGAPNRQADLRVAIAGGLERAPAALVRRADRCRQGQGRDIRAAVPATNRLDGDRRVGDRRSR